MLKINRNQQRLVRLDHVSLSAAAIPERSGLQEFIFNSADEFFSDFGEGLFVIGKEVQPSEVVGDRIDLLALDAQGRSVVIELKRGSDKLQLLQAIAYAGMIAQWSAADFLALVSQDSRDALLDFLEVEEDEINRSQRIMLIAEAYDYEVLVGAEWLEKSGIDICCCRIAVAKDEAAATEYLTCRTIFPPPELVAHATPRGKRSGMAIAVSPWSSWDDALKVIDNPPLVSFYNARLAAGQENQLAYRALIYRIRGRARLRLEGQRRRCYVWQYGRFPHDVETWRRTISASDGVKIMDSGRDLRFYLSTSADFERFEALVQDQLLGANWSSHEPVEVGEPEVSVAVV